MVDFDTYFSQLKWFLEADIAFSAAVGGFRSRAWYLEVHRIC